jgi:hypothetical protein
MVELKPKVEWRLKARLRRVVELKFKVPSGLAEGWTESGGRIETDGCARSRPMVELKRRRLD